MLAAGGGGMGALREAYREAMFEDPAMGLEGFLRRAAAGAYGPLTREAILDFLDETLRDTIGSIHTRAEASPEGAEEVERVIEERREAFARLAERYAPPP